MSFKSKIITLTLFLINTFFIGYGLLDYLSGISGEVTSKYDGTVVYVSGEVKQAIYNGNNLGYGTITFVYGDFFGAVAHGIPEIPSPRAGEDYYYHDASILGDWDGDRHYSGSNQVWGNILYNFDLEGLFGKVDPNVDLRNKREMEIGRATTGSAQILISVDSSGPQLFDVNILSVNYGHKEGINIWFRVIDSDFPGIYLGNSGSPIIQDGKLVGALSNVYKPDQSVGAGLAIQKMFEVLEENYLIISNEKKK
jgi:stage IV sporulation protein B